MDKILKNLVKINSDRLGALKNTTAILCKSESGSIYKLLNGESNNWWWRSISGSEISPEYYAIVMFVSYMNAGKMVSIPQFRLLINNTISNTKTPISSTITGLLIGNILFIKDAYYDPNYKLDFQIEVENNIKLKYSRLTNNVCFRGIFDIRTCCYYHYVSG
jgi:hypothetical protein